MFCYFAWNSFSIHTAQYFLDIKTRCKIHKCKAKKRINFLVHKTVALFCFCFELSTAFPDGQLFPASFVVQFPKLSYRRICNNCKCTKEDHEVGRNRDMNEKLDKLKVTDDNENIDDLSQYAWFPPGLEPNLVIF